MDSPLQQVPCVHVDCQNFSQVWPSLRQAIETCNFIAFDLELSGLGPKTNFKITDIDNRYEAFAETAKTRSILSIGLSTWRFTGSSHSQSPINRRTGRELDVSDPEDGEIVEDNAEQRPFCVGVWNVVCKRSDDSVLEDSAKQFLEDHGFDFERQQQFGIPYSTDNREESPLSRLWSALICCRKPLAVHNGFLDLIFLFQSFHLDVPSSLGSFTAELHDLFPAGIFDTKYITDNFMNLDASFLEFVFYYEQRKNLLRQINGLKHIEVSFTTEEDDTEGTEFRDMKTMMYEANTENIKICVHYSYHGWCSEGTKCDKSHDIDLILDAKDKKEKKRKNRLRMASGNGRANGKQQPTPTKVQRTPNGRVKSGAHRSGFDAFMTGYAFACIIAHQLSVQEMISNRLAKTSTLKDLADSLFLSGKTFPLKVRKGNFDHPSKKHLDKVSAIRKTGFKNEDHII